MNYYLAMFHLKQLYSGLNYTKQLKSGVNPDYI